MNCALPFSLTLSLFRSSNLRTPPLYSGSYPLLFAFFFQCTCRRVHALLVRFLSPSALSVRLYRPDASVQKYFAFPTSTKINNFRVTLTWSTHILKVSIFKYLTKVVHYINLFLYIISTYRSLITVLRPKKKKNGKISDVSKTRKIYFYLNLH